MHYNEMIDIREAVDCPAIALGLGICETVVRGFFYILDIPFSIDFRVLVVYRISLK